MYISSIVAVVHGSVWVCPNTVCSWVVFLQNEMLQEKLQKRVQEYWRGHKWDPTVTTKLQMLTKEELLEKRTRHCQEQRCS